AAAIGALGDPVAAAGSAARNAENAHVIGLVLAELDLRLAAYMYAAERLALEVPAAGMGAAWLAVQDLAAVLGLEVDPGRRHDPAMWRPGVGAADIVRKG